MTLKERLHEEQFAKQPSFAVRHGLWSNALILSTAVTSIWLLLCLYYTHEPLPYLFSLLLHLVAYMFLLGHALLRKCRYQIHWSMNLWPSIPIGLCNIVLFGFFIQYWCSKDLTACHGMHTNAVVLTGWWLWLFPVFVIIYLIIVGLTPDILSLLSNVSWSYASVIQEFQEKSNERPEIFVLGKSFHMVRTGGGDTDNSSEERVQTDCAQELFPYEDFRCIGPTLDLSELNEWKFPSLFQIVFETEPSYESRRALDQAVDAMRQRMLLQDQEAEATVLTSNSEIHQLVWPSRRTFTGLVSVYFLRFCVLLSIFTGTAFVFLCLLAPLLNVVFLRYVKEVTISKEFFEKPQIIVYKENVKDSVPLLNLNGVGLSDETDDSVVLESDSSGSPPRHESVLSESDVESPSRSLSPILDHSSPFESPVRS